VADACDALELLMLKGASGEAYNIGALDVLSVLEVTKLIVQHMTDAGDAWEKHIEFIPDRLFNDLDYNTSSAKMCALGWFPKIPLSKGIAELCC